MRALLMGIALIITTSFANAQEVGEKDLFLCQSGVAGFESFRIVSMTQTNSENQPVTTYQLRISGLFFDDVWHQSGEARLATESPVFQSVFFKKYQPPILPENPDEPSTLPQDPDEVYYLHISINLRGNGSISVNGELDPMNCQRAPERLH